MILSIFLFVFAGIFIAYDFSLIIMNPGTFLDNLTSFTHIWSAAGAYMIFAGIYRIKTKHSVWKKITKVWRLTIVSLLTIIFFCSVINLSFILRPKVADLETPGDYVILLGGGIDKNGVLPDSVLKRTEKACEYLKVNEEAICIVTGGTLKWLPYPEAPEIKRQLVARGIAENRVLVEAEALDTIQNFQNSLKMICENEKLSKEDVLEKRWIIVTSDFHLRRAERLAEMMGFTNVKGIAAKTPAFKVPHSLVREICSYVKLNARIIFYRKSLLLS